MSLSWHNNKQILSFDDTGELMLEIGTTRATLCRVCPRALARVSPVFKTMLYGGFAESKPEEGDWVVRFPEDKITGFALMLDIIHGHVHKVPRVAEDFDEYFESGEARMYSSLALDMVYHAARVADKYDLVHLLWPWAASWIELVAKSGSEDFEIATNKGYWRGQLLWIAWIFGDMMLMNDQLDSVLLSAYINNGDVPADSSSGGAVEETVKPDEEQAGGLNIYDGNLKDMPLSSPPGEENEILWFLDMPGKIYQRSSFRRNQIHHNLPGRHSQGILSKQPHIS